MSLHIHTTWAEHVSRALHSFYAPSFSLTNHLHPVSTTTGATSAASYFPQQQQQQAYTYSGLPTAATGTMSLPAAAAAYAAAAGPTTVNQTATVRQPMIFE